MAKKEEKKIVLERIYIIPLRREWQKVARYKKANKAIKFIYKFIARHMKLYDVQAKKKIKLSKFLNHAIWHRGIKKPPIKIEVKAIKYSTGEVEVELAKLPKKAEIMKAKEADEKAKAEAKRKEEEKAKSEAEKVARVEGVAGEKTPEEIEKEKKAEELKEEERLLQKERREVEHELIKPKTTVQQRKALQK